MSRHRGPSTDPLVPKHPPRCEEIGRRPQFCIQYIYICIGCSPLLLIVSKRYHCFREPLLLVLVMGYIYKYPDIHIHTSPMLSLFCIAQRPPILKKTIGGVIAQEWKDQVHGDCHIISIDGRYVDGEKDMEQSIRTGLARLCSNAS